MEESWKKFFNVTQRGEAGNVIIFGKTNKRDLLPIDFCKSGSFLIDDEDLSVYVYSQSEKTWTLV